MKNNQVNKDWIRFSLRLDWKTQKKKKKIGFIYQNIIIE